MARPGRPGPMPEPVPVYAGAVTRVVAPDALEVVVVLPHLGVRLERVVRLTGLHAPARDTPSGARVLAWLKDWLRAEEAEEVAVIALAGVDALGRPLAWVWSGHGRCLNEAMVNAGMAVGWWFGREDGTAAEDGTSGVWGAGEAGKEVGGDPG